MAKSLNPPDNIYTIDDNGKLTLHFHEGQIKAWDSDKRWVFIIAGSQSGKTSFAGWWLWKEINNTWKAGEDNDYLAVTASYDLFKLKFLPEMVKVFCDLLDIGRYWAADRLIELRCLDPNDKKHGEFYAKRATDPMWGRIILRSAQSESGLESATAKAALLDECGQPEFGIGAFRAIRRRLSLNRGRALGTTTPYNLGWLYENIYLEWLDGDETIDVIQFKSTANPNFSQSEYEDAKRTLPSAEFAMFYDGRFERPSGLIYVDFDPSTMLIEYMVPPREWERVVGIDFGGANVGVLFLAYDPHNGYWVAYDEILMGHMPTQEYVNVVNRRLEGCDTVTVIGGAKSEGQHRLDWWHCGLYVAEPFVYDLEPGISRGISLIKEGKLRVCRHLDRLRHEFANYQRKLDELGRPTEQILNKNRFHALDAYRYACSFITDQPEGVDIITYEDLKHEEERVAVR